MFCPLFHGVLDVCLVAVVIALGWSITGVIGALGVSAIVMAIVATVPRHTTHPHAAARCN